MPVTAPRPVAIVANKIHIEGFGSKLTGSQEVGDGWMRAGVSTREDPEGLGMIIGQVESSPPSSITQGGFREDTVV